MAFITYLNWLFRPPLYWHYIIRHVLIIFGIPECKVCSGSNITRLGILEFPRTVLTAPSSKINFIFPRTTDAEQGLPSLKHSSYFIFFLRPMPSRLHSYDGYFCPWTCSSLNSVWKSLYERFNKEELLPTIRCRPWRQCSAHMFAIAVSCLTHEVTSPYCKL